MNDRGIAPGSALMSCYSPNNWLGFKTSNRNRAGNEMDEHVITYQNHGSHFLPIFRGIVIPGSLSRGVVQEFVHSRILIQNRKYKVANEHFGNAHGETQHRWQSPRIKHLGNRGAFGKGESYDYDHSLLISYDMNIPPDLAFGWGEPSRRRRGWTTSTRGSAPRRGGDLRTARGLGARGRWLGFLLGHFFCFTYIYIYYYYYSSYYYY